MPYQPARPCRHPGCPNVTRHPRGYCHEHLSKGYHDEDRFRGSAAERGYDYRWHVESRRFLVAHPLCVKCLDEKPPRVVEAVVVDHIVPHCGDQKLFWDPNNWQPLCLTHHNQKSASER